MSNDNVPTAPSASHTRMVALGAIQNIHETTPGGFRPSKSSFREFIDGIIRVWVALAFMAMLALIASTFFDAPARAQDVEIVP